MSALARSVRESFLPLSTLLAGLLGLVGWLDGAASRWAGRELVIPIVATDAGWDAARLGEDGLVESGARAAEDPALTRPEIAEARRLAAIGDYAGAVSAVEGVLKTGVADATLWNELGVQLLRTGQAKEAVAALDKAVLLNPAYVRARFNRGIAFGRLGNVAGARSDYAAVLDHVPTHYEATLNLGLLNLEANNLPEALQRLEAATKLAGNESRAQALCALAAAQSRNDQRGLAFRTYERAIEFRPDYLLPRYNQAALLVAGGKSEDRERAGRLLDQLLRLAPDFAPAYFLKGRVASEGGDVAGALAQYEQAARLDRTFWKAHYNQALVALDLGRLNVAQPRFIQLAKDFPTRAEPHFNLGRIAYREERYRDAVDAYRKALAMTPDYPEAQLNLGLALDAAERFDEALAAFDAVRSHPQVGPSAELNRGLVLEHLSRLDEARAAFKAAEHARPGYPAALYNLARLDAKDGNHAQAALAYEQVLAKDPSNLKAAVNLGVERAASGDWTGAADAYRTALALSPDYPPALFNLGLALRNAKKLDEAADAYRRLIETDDENTKAYKNLAVVYALQGRHDQAALILLTALEGAASDTGLRFNLALQYVALKRDAGALSELTRVLKLEPTHLKAALTFATLQRAAGDLDAAAAAVEPFVRSAKPPAKARLSLALTRLAQGRRDAAAAELTAILDADATHARAIRLLLRVDAALGRARLQAALVQAPKNPALLKLQRDLAPPKEPETK